MRQPAIPSNEASRLSALRSLDILDTDAEERFDRLTRLARRLFDVPIALVSLVDAERQWFKSCEGLGVSETPRSVSFCAHAILGESIMLVPDTYRDERFRDNPLVLGEPWIRFYAGCPLRAPDGSKLGTLCVIDTRPRTLDHGDRQSLCDLARMAEQEIAALQLATMDELTGLSNRRGFLELGQHVLNLCVRRMERPATLLYFDLDGFKAVNDRFGHAEADRALAAFTALLLANFRQGDVVGRIGGGKFVVLMSNCAEGECGAAIERLQAAVAARNQAGGRGHEIGFSVGQVAYEAIRHGSIASLLANADALMHRRKKHRHSA
jgi:diguanylate cyclase (GGDEF)-like protein